MYMEEIVPDMSTCVELDKQLPGVFDNTVCSWYDGNMYEEDDEDLEESDKIVFPRNYDMEPWEETTVPAPMKDELLNCFSELNADTLAAILLCIAREAKCGRCPELVFSDKVRHCLFGGTDETEKASNNTCACTCALVHQ